MAQLADSSGIGWNNSGVCCQLCLNEVAILIGSHMFSGWLFAGYSEMTLAGTIGLSPSMSSLIFQQGSHLFLWWLQGAGKSTESKPQGPLRSGSKETLYLICCILLTKVSHKILIQWLNGVWKKLQSSHCQGSEYGQGWKIDKVFAINFHSRYFGILGFSPYTVLASFTFISLKFRKVWKCFPPSNKKIFPFLGQQW